MNISSVSRHVYLFGLLIIVISLPSSQYFTSIGQWLIVLSWFIDSNFLSKIKKIKDNKTLLCFLLLFLLHVAGILWSSNYAYWLHDVKIKLPLLIIPLVVATTPPVSKKHLLILLRTFCLSVFVVSLIGFYNFLVNGDARTSDFRDFSPFISHIRFSLFIVFVITMLFMRAVKDKTLKITIKTILFFFILWFVLCLMIMKSLTGIIILGILSFIYLLRVIYKSKSSIMRIICSVIIVIVGILSTWYIQFCYKKFSTTAEYNIKGRPLTTVNGNPYTYSTDTTYRRNGYLVFDYLCDSELRKEWNKLGLTPYDSLVQNKLIIRTNLILYMSGKGLAKDSIGFSKLTADDIQSIANGINNHIYTEEFTIYPRIHEFFQGLENLKRGRNMGGNSIFQRLYYLDAGWNIFLKNSLIGIGNGDVQDIFDYYYKETKSPLDPNLRYRTHNQILTLLLTFGIIGFIIILISQIYPVISSKKKGNLYFLFSPFIVIILLSMLNEDTLETQAGVTFYAFFYALLVWGVDPQKTNRLTDSQDTQLVNDKC